MTRFPNRWGIDRWSSACQVPIRQQTAVSLLALLRPLSSTSPLPTVSWCCVLFRAVYERWHCPSGQREWQQPRGGRGFGDLKTALPLIEFRSQSFSLVIMTSWQLNPQIECGYVSELSSLPKMVYLALRTITSSPSTLQQWATNANTPKSYSDVIKTRLVHAWSLFSAGFTPNSAGRKNVHLNDHSRICNSFATVLLF